jgi:hypothetical protein
VTSRPLPAFAESHESIGMRIAVTGTHGSGKTTLIDDFTALRPDYDRELEPYWALAQDGIPFADGVSQPALEQQIEASTAMILARADSPRVIFDRCPLDFIAYLEIVGEGEGHEWEPTGKLLGKIERSLACLDLIVFLPLSQPDEIATRIEFPALRQKVDTRLKRIMRPDQLDMLVSPPPPVLVLRGNRDQRVAKLAEVVA